MSQPSDEKFEQELFWCIEQLQLGLETQNPNSKQAIEATKILKILLSSKAPIIKKRQAMRNALGDYRKKMADSAKKSLAAVKKMKLQSGDEAAASQKSRFYKKSSKVVQPHTINQELALLHTNNDCNTGDNNSGTQSAISKHSESIGADCCEDLSAGFKFSFNIKGSDKEQAEDSNHDDMNLTNDLPGKTSEKTTSDVTSVPVETFHRSDNSFRFNFASQCE